MTRFVGTATLVVALILVNGCRQDPREAPIQNVMQALRQSEQDLKAINTGLTEALELKTGYESDTAKLPDLEKKLNEILGNVDDLLKQAEKIRDQIRIAEKRPPAGTDKEKLELAKRFQAEVVEITNKISQEDLALQKTLKTVVEQTGEHKDSKVRSLFTNVVREYQKADNDFKNISGLLR